MKAKSRKIQECPIVVTVLEIGQFKIALEIRHFKNEGRLSFRKEFWDRYLVRAIELSGT